MLFEMSGRSLSNSVINLGIRDQYADALSQLGFEYEVVAEQVSHTVDRFHIQNFDFLRTSNLVYTFPR